MRGKRFRFQHRRKGVFRAAPSARRFGMKLSEDAGFFAADQQARRTAGMQIRQIRFRFKFVFFDFPRLTKKL